MSLAEAPAKPIFGPITADDMRENTLLLKTVFPLVREACQLSRGRFDADRVFDGLIDGSMKLWGVLRPPSTLESILVTETRGEVLSVLVLGPTAQKALGFLPALEVHARASGCGRMQVVGPKLWRHRPSKEGTDFVSLSADWQEVACVFEKELVAR